VEKAACAVTAIGGDVLVVKLNDGSIITAYITD
jgi:hypothetical protein